MRVSSRDDITAVQLTPKPPTGSWAEYLGARYYCVIVPSASLSVRYMLYS